jgi:hypothetical protein
LGELDGQAVVDFSKAVGVGGLVDFGVVRKSAKRGSVGDRRNCFVLIENRGVRDWLDVPELSCCQFEATAPKEGNPLARIGIGGGVCDQIREGFGDCGELILCVDFGSRRLSI